VRAVDFMGDTAVVAVGSDGVHVVQLWPDIKLLNRYDTHGFAMEVKVRGKRVYVAEEKGGLSIWRQSGRGALTFESRYKPRGRIVRDVVVPPPGRFAILQVDLSILDILDVSNPAKPKRVLRDKGYGFVYDIAEDLTDEQSVCVLWQLGGLRWYDLYGAPLPAFSGRQYAHRLGGDGTAPFGDKRLVIYWGGLVVLDPEEQRPPTEMKIHRVGRHRLRGRPLLLGNTLYASDRRMGDISIVDVSDVTKPTLIERLNLPGNPGRLVLHNDTLVIPNGYEGLWIDGRAPR